MLLTLSASPRAGGNCDTAARILTHRLQGHIATGTVNSQNVAGLPNTVHTQYIRDYSILPCVSCGTCETSAPQYESAQYLKHFFCPLAKKDTSLELLHPLVACSTLCIVAPIYFYHLPAAFKGLIDRTQTFWNASLAGANIPAFAAPRKCFVVLIAARPVGEQLFAGALLSLGLALKGLNMHMSDSLLLRGLDAAGSVQNNSATVEQLEQYADYMWHTLTKE